MSRVLQLVTRDEPGGVRALTRMVAQGLAARGHVVTTLALLGDGGSPLRMIREILSGRYHAVLSYQVAAGLVGSAAGWVARVPIRATHLTAIPPPCGPPGVGWIDAGAGWGCIRTSSPIPRRRSGRSHAIRRPIASGRD